MKLFKAKKGIHIPGKKDETANLATVNYTSPEYVYIPLSVKGSDFEVLVNPGDQVKLGQVIARRPKEKGLPIVLHSSVSGEVIGKERKNHQSGLPYQCIKIKNDFKDTSIEFHPVSNIDNIDNSQLIEMIHEAGVVGLGGAGFPTHLKFESAENIDTIILNGAECEPYLTADYRIMIEETDKIIDGLKIMMKISGAKRGIIAIKQGKRKPYEALLKAIKDEKSISVSIVPDTYPAGWEKQVVYRTLKRSYENYPFECGVIVNNVATSKAVSDAITRGMPLIERIVTVSGEGIIHPQNYRVRIGTLSTELIEKSGGMARDMGDLRIVAGGPMMGIAQKKEEFVISSGVAGILVFFGIHEYEVPHNQPVGDVLLDVLHFTEHDDRFMMRDEQPCVRCGSCVNNCPAGLQPTLLRTASLAKDEVMLEKLDVTKCIDCGTCAYVCPSHIQINAAIKKGKAYYLAKNKIKNNNKK